MIEIKETPIFHPEYAKTLFKNALALVNEALLLSSDTTVNVDFCGSGDSGQVDDVRIPDELSDAGNNFTYIRFLRNTGYRFNQEKEAISYTHYTRISLAQFFAMLSDDLLEMTGVNYYDNEGGQGEITFTASENGLTWILNIGQNYDSPESEEYDKAAFFGMLGEPDELEVLA